VIMSLGGALAVRRTGVSINYLDSYKAVNPRTREVKHRKQEFSLATTVDVKKEEKKAVSFARPTQPRPPNPSKQDGVIETFTKKKPLIRDRYREYIPAGVNDDFSRISGLVDHGELAWLTFLETVKWVSIGSFIYVSTEILVKDMKSAQETVEQCQTCLDHALQHMSNRRIELTFCRQNFPNLFTTIDDSIDVFSQPTYEPNADEFGDIGIVALSLSIIASVLFPSAYILILFYSESVFDSLRSWFGAKKGNHVLNMPPLIVLLEIFGFTELIFSFLVTWFIGSVHLYKPNGDNCYYSVLNVDTESARYSFFIITICSLSLYLLFSVYFYGIRFHRTSALSYILYFRTVFNIGVFILLTLATVFACLSMVSPLIYAENQPIVYFTVILLTFSWLEAWGFLILPRNMIDSTMPEEETVE